VPEVVYPQLVKSLPIANADPYLNSLLVKYCDDALSKRRGRPATWRLRVENAIAPLLPALDCVVELGGLEPSTRPLSARSAGAPIKVAKIAIGEGRDRVVSCGIYMQFCPLLLGEK
jgi:hypothetical protein